MCRVHTYFRILYLGGANIYYFDVKGAQIFLNTLFRGGPNGHIILMSMVHEYFRILYLGGCKHSFLF